MRVRFDLDRVSPSQLHKLLDTFPRMKIKVVGYSVRSEQPKKTSTVKKPITGVNRFKLFMEIFNAMSGPEKKGVDERALIQRLVEYGNFTEGGARNYIKWAVENSRINLRSEGIYVKV